MSFPEIVLLAIGLAMDATAVAAAKGLSSTVVRPRHALLVASFFGGFQALMPGIGWLVGTWVGPVIRAWDHWIAFLLLSALGIKMLRDARAADGVGPRDEGDPFRLRVLLLFAVATSIDALAVGVTLPMLGAPLAASLLTIGLVTAALSAAGLYAGRRFGVLLGQRLDAVGGLVLIGLGVRILLQHLQA